MNKRKFLVLFVAFLVSGLIFFSVPAFADSPDVANAVTSAYTSYIQPQIKAVVNNVVFRIIDIILLVSLIAKLSMSVYSYRHNGNQFEWHAVFFLFCGLILSLTAPLWIWSVIK